MRDAWRCVRPGRDPSSTTPMPIWNESSPRCCRRVLKGKPSPTLVKLESANPLLRRRRPGNRQQRCRSQPARYRGRTQLSSVLTSFITTCKRLDNDPFAYLRDIFEHIAHTGNQLVELLPRQVDGCTAMCLRGYGLTPSTVATVDVNPTAVMLCSVKTSRRRLRRRCALPL